MLIVVTAVIVVGGVYFYKKKMQPPTHDTVALTRVSYIIVFGSDRSSRNANLRSFVCPSGLNLSKALNLHLQDLG